MRAPYGQNVQLESLQLKNLITAKENSRPEQSQEHRQGRHCSYCENKETARSKKGNGSTSNRHTGQSTTKSANSRKNVRSSKNGKQKRAGQSCKNDQSESFNFEKAFQDFQTT